MKVSKTSPQNNLEIFKSENDKERKRKKNINLQKKARKLLMIWDKYNSIIMEYQKIINFLDSASNQPLDLGLK